MAGKKKFNAKSFLVNHAEKLGFGVIALTVTGIWASEFLGGSWSRERRSPAALIQEIDKKKAEIDKTPWPEDKQASFKPVDFSERATTLLRPINISKYELSTEFFVPLNRPKEKAREAEYLAVEDLIATSGHVILAVLPEEVLKARQAKDEEDEEESMEPESDEEQGEFTRRDAGAGTPARNRTAEDFAAPNVAAPRPGDAPPPRRTNIAAGALRSGGAALPGQQEALRMDKGRRTRRGLSGESPSGRFYVAVRGVWPVNRQLERIQRALHLPTKAAAIDHLELMDFDLERQVATRGDNPWTKPWEKLDISRSLEILKEVGKPDDEPVDMEVIDPVITMSLPMRAFGAWTDPATHPKIKNYLLTPEGKEREKLVMSRLLEEREKMKAEMEKVPQPSKKRGFAPGVNDFRRMANDMNRANSRGMNEAMRGIAQDMRGQADSLSPEKISAKLTAVGQLLLFRFLDFDVRPGYAYRYRVKLKLRNPNFDRPVSEVTDPSVAIGPERETPFSNVSNPAVVPVTPKYFLHGIERHPLAEDGKKTRSVASVNMFELHKELGTQVSSVLEMIALGQFIGGDKEIDVLDVTVPEIDKQVYPFSSEDMLLDVHADTELQPDLHPDLKLEAKKSNKAVELGLAPEAIVIDGGGELRVLAAGQDDAEERALKSRLRNERKVFEGSLKKQEAASSPLDAGLGMRLPGTPEDKASKDKARKAADPVRAAPNPRRKPG